MKTTKLMQGFVLVFLVFLLSFIFAMKFEAAILFFFLVGKKLEVF